MPRGRRESGALAAPPSEQLDALARILAAVRLGGVRTRLELAESVGLGRATVAQRVGELLAAGVLEDGERGPSTGGRAPRIVRLSPSAGHLLVAELGATHLHAAVTDAAGSVLAGRRERLEIALGPETVLDRVDELFDALVAETSP